MRFTHRLESKSVAVNSASQGSLSTAAGGGSAEENRDMRRSVESSVVSGDRRSNSISTWRTDLVINVDSFFDTVSESVETIIGLHMVAVYVLI